MRLAAIFLAPNCNSGNGFELDFWSPIPKQNSRLTSLVRPLLCANGGLQNISHKEPAMEREEHTTIVMQRYLGQLAKPDGSAPVEPIIEELIDSSVSRLYLLCRTLLVRSYPRLARPPLNLQPEELLSAVVDRLLHALRKVRPTNIRQFFALANRHMRWELNDLARRLDKEPVAVEFDEALVESPATDDSELSPNARRMLDAVEELPDEEREAFDLIRIQNLTQPEAAEVVGVSESTLRRRLNRGLLLLTEQLSDLQPSTATSECY
jgi:RNA polymerase sigma-70 factor (ECF subfamily)